MSSNKCDIKSCGRIRKNGSLYCDTHLKLGHFCEKKGCDVKIPHFMKLCKKHYREEKEKEREEAEKQFKEEFLEYMLKNLIPTGEKK